jgi:hypothetical protein
VTSGAVQRLDVLARLVLGVLVLLTIAGIVWHGITVQTFERIWHQLIERPSGPMAFRFILQPSMAALAAILHGRRDARTGRTPYFWALLTRPGKRAERLREGLNATARVILLGIVMDVIYQIIVLKRFYPAEAVIVALLLGFLPYLVFRGMATRTFLWWSGNHSARQI